MFISAAITYKILPPLGCRETCTQWNASPTTVSLADLSQPQPITVLYWLTGTDFSRQGLPWRSSSCIQCLSLHVHWMCTHEQKVMQHDLRGPPHNLEHRYSKIWRGLKRGDEEDICPWLSYRIMNPAELGRIRETGHYLRLSWHSLVGDLSQQ